MIPREVVEKVAELARLDLTEDEIETMRRELNRILEFVEKLNGLELPETPPAGLRDEAALPLREDRAVPFPSDDLIEQAPSINDRFFEVPIIIREGGTSGT